jgi:hypothetical protein
VLYAIPVLVAGDMLSLWKYIEHMCLTGLTVLGLTRTVVLSGPLGRVQAFTLFNIPNHSVRHYYARLHRFTAVLAPQSPEEQTIYPSYWSAFRAMLPRSPTRKSACSGTGPGSRGRTRRVSRPRSRSAVAAPIHRSVRHKSHSGSEPFSRRFGSG